MRRLRLFCLVLRRSGAVKVLFLFTLVFLLCGVVVLFSEPSVTTYGDALWFLWAVSTTVGLGDITAVTAVGRIAVMVCSLFAIGSTAIVTGVIVDFFGEVRQRQLDGALSEFLDRLERLPELSEDELQDISRRVKELRK